ncbi:MAG: hypothetical protein E7284_10100 [Lachnospiraceae bacterium]|nr:hypothetical protein [Lachnospiraceae bacterium]
MEHQITLDEWLQWKEDIRRKLAETAGNFVHIGYRLKQIRDSGMFDGASDIFEFAQKEYGLAKSTVSRFIAINEKFSEGGNSLELKEEFRAIGSSKLAEMLTLSDSECLMITEKTTVKDIRELKQFSRQQVPEGLEETNYTPLQKCIIELFNRKEKREILNKVLDLLMNAESGDILKDVVELINPSGYATCKKGIIFLFLYDMQTGIKYKSMVEPNPVNMEWLDFLIEITKIYGEFYMPAADTWANFYGEPAPDPELKKGPEKTEEMPKNQDVATSQQTAKKEVKTDEKESRKDCIKGEDKTSTDDSGESECSVEEMVESDIDTSLAEKEITEHDAGNGEAETEGSDTDNESASKVIDNIQSIADTLDEVYSWDEYNLPQIETVKAKKNSLNMLIIQLERLEKLLEGGLAE